MSLEFRPWIVACVEFVSEGGDMALMLKLAVLMHVSFLRRAIYAVQAVTNALLSVLLAGALSPPPSQSKNLSDGARCSRIEGSGRGRQLCARASLSSGRSYFRVQQADAKYAATCLDDGAFVFLSEKIIAGYY